MIEIADIQWKHIKLVIFLEGDFLTDYDYFIGDFTGKRYPLVYQKKNLLLNIMAVPETEVLSDGKWYFFARNRFSMKEEIIRMKASCGYILEDREKIYRYAQEQCAYAITFGIKDGTEIKSLEKSFGVFSGEEIQDEELFLYLYASFFRKNKSEGKKNPFSEADGWKDFIKKAGMCAARCILNGMYMCMYAVRKKDGTRILMMSETRTPMGGNLKALDDRLKERRLDARFRITYSFSETLKESPLKKMKHWFRLIWLIAGQDFIFVDDYVPVFQSIHLKPYTKLIQLWHAGIGCKAVGYARFGRSGSPHPLGTCHRRYDAVVVGASGLMETYEEVFGLPKEKILPLGLPRMDQYRDEQYGEQYRRDFYERYPEIKGRRVILFAPTYRGVGQRDAYYPWDKIDFSKVKELCGNEYMFIIKQHPFIKKAPDIPEAYRLVIRVFPSEVNINDLFYVTDILITDYSSNIYEFALQNKPMLFFVFDKDYYQLTRGVQRRLEEFVPGKICMTFDEVIEAVRTEDFENERRKAFIQSSYDSQKGLAADRVIEKILGIPAEK